MPLLFLLLLFLPATLQAQPDAATVLDRTAATYRDLSAYHFAGTMTLDVKAGEFEQTVEMPIVLAAQEPGKRRIEIENPVLSLVTVSDGDATWIYTPDANQYMKRNAAAVGEKGVGAADLTQKYKRLNERVVAAEVMEETTLNLGGDVRPVWVVRVTYEPIGASVEETPTTYWIERDTYLVLRESSGARQGGTEVKTTITYTTIDTQLPLAPDLFTFTIPTDAQQVETMELPGLDLTDRSGERAEAFMLPQLDGQTFDLAAHTGKVVVLDFWATWCGPCREQMPHLQKLQEEYDGADLVVVGINQLEETADVQAYLEANPFTFPILLDADGEIGLLYGAAAIPTTVVIGRDGIIAAYLVGAQTEETLRDALRKAGLR